MLFRCFVLTSSLLLSFQSLAACDDTSPLNDGWGWDGVQSCRISQSTQECVDVSPVGDGWGWDGTASCRLSENQQFQDTCIDTPPLNDGWGWNGSSSCRVTGTTTPVATSECVDTLPLNDGWGWNGSTSCQLSTSTNPPETVEAICVDSTPIGDGWGWDGTRSCRLDTPTNNQPEETIIMPVGDSITHGSRGQRSYRYYLIPMLDQAGCDHTMVGSQNQNDTSTGFISAHESYSTMRADHFLTGHTTWSGTNEGIQTTMNRYNPDVVMLHIGSNDVYFHQSPESTVDEIRQIVSIITNTNPNATVLVSNIVPWFGRSDFNRILLGDSEQLGIQISAFVRELNDSSVRFVDVFSGFTRDMMISDLVHPNDEGEKHVATAFYDAYIDAGLCR